MNQKTIPATLYSQKNTARAYIQTKFFTLKVGNTHAYDFSDVVQISDGIIYPYGNEGNISTDTLLLKDHEELTKEQQGTIKLLISHKNNTAYIKSYTENLPYEPYHIAMQNQVYKVTNPRTSETITDPFLHKTTDLNQKVIVTNTETGISDIKTTNEIETKTEIVLPFST